MTSQDPSYLSDEALLSLIALSEEQGLLTAPKALKPEILAQAQARQTKPAADRRGRLLAYSLRVALATAACLVLLFAKTPSLEPVRTDTENNANLSQQLSRMSDQLGEQYQTFTQQLSQQFLGGAQDEQPAE